MPLKNSPAHSKNDLKRRHLLLLLPCVLGGVALAGTVGAAQPEAPAATAQGKHTAALPGIYRVINLGPGGLSSLPKINDKDQVAFTHNNTRAMFYDGTSVQDIGTLGGSQAYALDLNNAGQVVGSSSLPGDPPFGHAYLWSRATGMIDLGTLGGTASGAVAVNNHGQVTGSSRVPNSASHAFRWSPAFGLEDIGLFPGAGFTSFTAATDISDTGLVTGWGSTANDNGHAFAWTRKTGLVDLGTLGGSFSYAEATNARGQVAGYATVPGDGAWHAFIWDARHGLRDLGTAGGSESFSLALNDLGQVVGVFNIADGQRAFSWTPSRGIVDLGTLGGPGSRAIAVNNKGQVVGGSTTRGGTFHAFVWSAREGMVDLNKRLRHAPAGLVVDFASAISDNGAIVATSNAGLVLLKPDCGCPGTHAVGPIAAVDMVEVGAPLDSAVSFAGADTAARYHVTWSWGDGTADQAGNARASNGSGSATGNHRYAAPGIYTISARVTDLGGKSATVTRSVIAYDTTGAARGSGSFMSPQGANRKERSQAGMASFSFIAPAPMDAGAAAAKATAAKAELQFQAGSTTFHSRDVRPVAVQGRRAQFEGSGTLNGASDYRFTLTTTAGGGAGPSQAGRFGLKIWHVDPATGAEVVDYDNRQAGPGDTGPAVEGSIVHPL
jgi:probable HAF family extracellular repeat protein